jgi:putative ABC transport system permease protein
VQLPPARYDAAQAGSFFQETLARVARLPGVQSAAGAACPPMPGSCIGTSFWRADRPRPADGQLSSGQIRPITPAFFKTLRIRQMSGRDFSDSDTVDSTPVAIISDALVHEHFPDGSPLGRRLRINIDHANGKSDVEWTIVGVVSSIKSSLDGPVRQTIYLPTTQSGLRGLRFFARTAQDPMLLAPSVEGVVHSREPGVPVEIRTLDDIVGGTIARPRAISVLVSVFALVALALAAVGVYGVMAYSVRERTQEIGVRMALGATALSVFRLVIGQALRLVALGVVSGLICAGLLTRLLDRLLFEVEPFDPWTFAATAAVLLGVAAVASYVPARRGMRMAPVDALRSS